MKNIILPLALFCMFYTISCGGDDSETSSHQGQLGQEFTGIYLSGCIRDEDGDFVSKRLSISDSKIVKTEIYYGDVLNNNGSNCSQESEMKIVSEQKISVIGNYQEATIVKGIPTSMKITYYKEEYVSEVNKVGLYGKHNWKKGVEQDVTEAVIASLKATYEDYYSYGIIKLDGNLLFTNEYSLDKGDQNPSVTTGKMYIKEGSLKGEYLSECYKGEEGQSFRNKLVFSDTQMEFTSTEYKYEGGTVTCNDNDFQKRSVGIYDYNFQKEYLYSKINYPYPIEITSYLRSYKVTPLKSDVVEDMNTSSFLGKNDWMLNTEKDVTQEYITENAGNFFYFDIGLDKNTICTSKIHYEPETRYEKHQYTRIK